MNDQVAVQETSHVAVTHYGAFFAQVYGWMTGGLLVTTFVSLVINLSPPLLLWLFRNWDLAFPMIIISEFALVIIISLFMKRLHPIVAVLLFFAYAAVNGVFFAAVLAIYTTASIFTAFAATAGTFFIMAAYGLLTKSDLGRWGSMAFMALIGVILGTVVNLFLQSDALGWLMTYIGLGVFIILVAYDHQKIKYLAEVAEREGDGLKYSILGALELYLDFINILIRLIAIFGKRK